MARKDLMGLYGRLGLMMAAFAIVIGIVAAPLIERVWPSPVTLSENNGKPAARPIKLPSRIVAEKNS